MRNPEGWWTARLATFVSIVVASALAAAAMAELSADALEDSLDAALGDHLRAEAGLVAELLVPEPLEAVALLGGGEGADALGARIDGLASAALLRDAVVLDPDGEPLGRTPTDPWLAARADASLMGLARTASVAGTLYRTAEGELYKTAYSPVPGHPGYVVGVEGSGETLRAVDQIEDLQLVAGLAVLALAAGLGAVLASALSRPLSGLETELGKLTPGAPAEEITVWGPREVRRVARSVQGLLVAIRERDAALRSSHTARLAEVTTLAATVAHEVRNPVNALGIIFGAIRSAEGPERRDQLLTRGEGCVLEIERIVERFLDLSRPVAPRSVPTDLAIVARSAATEVEARLVVTLCGESRAVVDPELFGQVLRNLLRNAAEAGAASARIELRPGEVVVSDDGPGIDVDPPERVFDWFHTTHAQGTGLGLPLSRRICRAFGGELLVISARPAIFRLLLPPESP